MPAESQGSTPLQLEVGSAAAGNATAAEAVQHEQQLSAADQSGRAEKPDGWGPDDDGWQVWRLSCHDIVLAPLLAPLLTGFWHVAERSIMFYRMMMSSGSRWMTARQQQQQQQRSRPQTSRSQRRQWHRAQCPSRAAQQQPQLRRAGPRSTSPALLQQIKLPSRQATS